MNKKVTKEDITNENNLGKWDVWYGELKDKSSFRYGDTLTYTKAATFLDDCKIVEDWGVGAGGFLRHMPNAIGVDGSNTPFASVIADLTKYLSTPNGINMRHVLEHNYGWEKILRNVLTSAKDKLCLTLFIPLSDGETTQLAHNLIHGVDVPDLSISKTEFQKIFDEFSDKIENIEIEEFKTNTGYNIEIMYNITMKKN